MSYHVIYFSDIGAIHYHYFILCQQEKEMATYLCQNISPENDIFLQEHLFNDILKIDTAKLKLQVEFPFNHLKKLKSLMRGKKAICYIENKMT